MPSWPLTSLQRATRSSFGTSSQYHRSAGDGEDGESARLSANCRDRRFTGVIHNDPIQTGSILRIVRDTAVP